MKKSTYYIIILAVLGAINLLILIGGLYNSSGGEATAANLGSIFGSSLAILVLYGIARFALSHIKDINTKLSKKEITIVSLSIALLIYFLLGIASGKVAEVLNEFERGFERSYLESTTNFGSVKEIEIKEPEKIKIPESESFQSKPSSTLDSEKFNFVQFISEVESIEELIAEKGARNIVKAMKANNEIWDAIASGKEYDINKPFNIFTTASTALTTARVRAEELSTRTPSKYKWVVINLIMAANELLDAHIFIGNWMFDSDLNEEEKEHNQTQGDFKMYRAIELLQEVDDFITSMR